MSRLTQLLHLDDGEFVQARAAAEAKPPARRRALKPGSGGSAISYLTASAPVERHPHGRFTVAALVPPGHLELVPLTAAAPNADAEALIADVRALTAGTPQRTAKAGC